MRFHVLSGVIVLFLGVYYGLPFVELILLISAVSFVLFAELINTAIEYLSDVLVKEEFHPAVKIIKDIGAGAVFIAAINACFVGYLILSNHIDIPAVKFINKIKHSSWHITFIVLFISVALVLAIKILRKEHNLFRGGMPSGHTAVAFSVWTMVTLFTTNPLVSFLVLLLALIIARSRLVRKIHSFWEVIAGAVVGILVSLFIVQVMV
ncbi:Diacylglycerol kinase, prokaryotic [Candidatus Omnitrophus magneticus]|uniref:Diacylglycerol kinase, prokaryotic n=1 Tax=Candidatus Omnitrophus magneticus TaxID=1609969 RepID=A0A0F0CRW2_9BACT|nr:Diacylglycerol kinase, prokaryotic [Candidatus Omnitrophus magneticus]